MNAKRLLEAEIKRQGKAKSSGSARVEGYTFTTAEAILRARATQQHAATEDPLAAAVVAKTRRFTTALNSAQLLRDALAGNGTVVGDFDA